MLNLHVILSIRTTCAIIQKIPITAVGGNTVQCVHTLLPISGVTHATTRPFLHLSCHLSPARSPMQIICPTALIWLELSDTYCATVVGFDSQSLQIAGRHGNLQHMPHRTRICEARPGQARPSQTNPIQTGREWRIEQITQLLMFHSDWSHGTA